METACQLPAADAGVLNGAAGCQNQCSAQE